MKKNRLLTAMLAVVSISMSVFGLTSCEPRLQAADVAFAEPILDNIFSAMVDHDYPKFSADLSDAMKEAIEKQGFQSVISGLQESLGAYKGREFEKAVKANAKDMELVIVTYRGQFEKDAKAKITIYISDTDGVKKVEGFMAVPSGGVQ